VATGGKGRSSSKKIFFGTGESFLFVLAPQFRLHPWTGHNDNILFASEEGVAMGSSSGAVGEEVGGFGLFIDASLFHGSTSACDTFASRPLTEAVAGPGATTEDGPTEARHDEFEVVELELWGFSSSLLNTSP
jgi:hypothetical protein